MSLIDKIRADQVAARKNKDSLKATLLTTLLGELGRDGSSVVITDEKVVATVKKFVKGMDETLKYVGQSNPISYGVVKTEKEIMEAYLPKQMTKEQIKGAILSQWKSPLNKGQLMSWLKANYAGEYDGKDAAAAVDELIKAKDAT